jgi:tetratricopeptide (TPR) repeat protein
MAKNCLRINHEGDSIQLSWQRGHSNPRPAPSVTFTHPFDKQALADLRWYLEEYLRFPYGLAPDNAAKIEQKFQDWGEQLFELVFRSSEQARQFFQAATYEGLNQCELVITSDSPEVLNLPWELLYSPSDRQFLAPSLAGMSRSLSDYAVRAEMSALPQDKLNILLVIARPYGEKDIALRTIARPLLAAVANIRQKVNLKVLRPPSFEQFERELNANRGFYHIVHFDGHGDFDPNSIGFQHTLGAAGQGVLVFEKNDGSPDIVTAAQIAQNLADCRVPIFVLNACKSGQEGEEKFSSVATRLVSLGAKGVVAMAYSVYAEAAKHFMGRLYGELAAGATLDSAVAAGRKDVLNKRLRPSPKGDKPLQDWLVPVLYQQESYTPFIPTTTEIDVLDIEAFLEPTVSNLVGFPEEGAYGFIGRDYDILGLERAFRQNNIVLLEGMAGVGKTELACGFARWLDQTQGRTGKMFFMSFEQGATLSNVVNQVGREVWGDKFAQYRAEQQQQAVLKYLKTQPSLLIWDNFEPVAGFPAGNEPLLNASEQDSLQRFLKDLRGGKSWVLITSRREESWLDCGYRLVELRGLREQDVEELAAKILQSAGVDRAKLSSEYLELLKLLGGHPFSLRVVLPHLKTQQPKQLIEALRQGLDTFQGAEEEGRDKSLSVSLDYSFSKLSEPARQHLPFLALFSERVNADLLNAFSGTPDNNNGQAYQAVFRENLQKQYWLWILNEAATAGILEHLGSTIYKIHPALSWYLRQHLTERHAAKEVSKLEKKLLVFYALLASAFDEQLISNADMATSILRFEEPNLLENLRLALQQHSWAEAQAILQALGEVYERLDRKPEFKVLRQRALNLIGIRLIDAKAKGQDVFDFWMYLRGVDANEAMDVPDWEQANAIYQEILNEITALNDSAVNGNIASLNHNLGNIAIEKRQFDEAATYYQKALKIFEDAGDDYKAAGVYHQLGRVAQDQRQFGEAGSYYQKALKIFEDAEDVYNAAHVYHQLGVVAKYQRQFDEAQVYYQKAAKIREETGDLYNATNDYHELGNVAHYQRQFDEAKAYYKQAMKIREDAGNYYNAAREYQGLGVVAQEQQRFDEATAYYQKALKIFEDAGDDYGASYTCQKLGEVAKDQGNFESAIAYFQRAFAALSAGHDWYRASLTLTAWSQTLEAQSNWDDAAKISIQALGIDLEHNKEWIGEDIKALGRVLKVLEESQFEAVWREVTGEELTEEWRSAIQAASEENEE